MSKTLVMNFLTDQGKKSSIRFKEIKDNVDDSVVSGVMDTIIEKNIFITSSGELKVKDSAQIIDTTIEELNI
ncbi:MULTISPECIES: DUF2922 domain-containing protein [Clostridium]|uniref:DUF2922 domain-containing protein n=2 Tax=Clostridium TaxID=1485 RepID=A0A151APU3_9CLOT|nr:MULTISPECIES: DUF2922 domain-containing protein [Clostridium]KYH29661.1 hypothetical protein CLCOL_08920 [Clostridium colicanis DSM 13634]MBE6043962.1 DUF2922 domain-containing protein [Clostridium thermopalmarium]PRR72112.1 hypothetical protein CPAL_15990 [Clostridium thermopalmarium DSM 5974]PVZ23764.1 Protein of unknown function (DUF2922) [Clostridium thermopalmarium DSM 5974]